MPRQTLTREQIVTAAVELLDTEGLEGLNMRALGRRLGSAATAVYWHVGGRDELIVLAGDRIWQEIGLPDPAETGWRPAATTMATDLYAMLTRHPWLVQAFGTLLLIGPGKARHDDHLLAVYEAAGFTGAQAEQASAAVFTYVLGNAVGPAAMSSLTRRLSRDDGDAEALLRDNMTKATEIALQFPRLKARIDEASASTTGYGAGPDDGFEFGLAALFDGLQARLGGE